MGSRLRGNDGGIAQAAARLQKAAALSHLCQKTFVYLLRKLAMLAQAAVTHQLRPTSLNSASITSS